MKNLNLNMVCASLALSAAALLPTTLAAQTLPAPVLMGAGSSALFNTLAVSAFTNGNAGAPVCGLNHWSYKSGNIGSSTEASIVDTRSSDIGNEPATVWIAWNGSADGTTTPPTVICAYFQVDSTVGVRAALARTAAGAPAAQGFLNGSLAGAAGQGKVPGFAASTEAALPANVLASVSGAPITFAGADIRVEDAKFATTRTLAAQGANVNTVPWSGSFDNSLVGAKGLGYANPADTFSCAGDNTTPIGYPIDSIAGTVANPVDFALFGTDPISCGAAASYYKEFNIGAGPIIVFVNTTNTSTGHLGDANLTNISSETLSGFLDGTFSRTRDLFTNYAAGTLGSFPVKTFLREPLSGTYNVTEYNIPDTNRFSTTQEKGVTGGPVVTPFTAGSSMNPLSLTNPNGVGGRYRAVGTGEMIKDISGAQSCSGSPCGGADSLGYAFWGYGNFSSGNIVSTSTVRYLTLDGVDPLYSGPSANPNGVGIFPLPSGSPLVYPAVPMPNIVNGSYPAWTIFRIVSVPEANNSYIKLLVTDTQLNASIYSDFIPSTSLNVFRSHYYQASIGGDDGNTADPGVSGVYFAEQGGDAGGQVFPIQADYDFIADSVAETGSVKALENRHK